MSRRRRIARGVVGVLLLAVGVQQAWRHGHDYVFAEKFATVVAGKIHRGAWQKAWPMRSIVRTHGIQTIVALAHPPDHPLVEHEKTLAAELGVRWVHIPIVDTRTPGDPTISDRLAEAAAVIADPANQPVYFHCHHGVNRASMVQMAYRMLHCGWDLERAQAEIARSFGLVEVNHGPDYRHMAAFYRERVLPARQAAARPRAEVGTASAIERR